MRKVIKIECERCGTLVEAKSNAQKYCQKCNKDIKKGSNKEYRKNNKEKINEYKRIYDKNNKEIIKDYKKEYANKNKEIIKDYKKIYYKNNKEKLLENIKAYCKNNKEKINTYKRKYYKDKYESNIDYKISMVLRSRIRKALKQNKKINRSINLLGCSIRSFKCVMALKFELGMTWKNHGLYTWHIDHIKPCASFDLSDSQQQKECFHWSNMQPLWAEDNLKKSAKLE